MTMMVTDAYGRDVRDLGTCARCLAAIKYKYEFRGETYGSECILVVTGQKKDYWVIKDGVIDEAATAERDEQKRIDREERQRVEAQRVEAYRLRCEQIQEKQGFLIDFFTRRADPIFHDFNSSMAQELSKNYIFDLSPRQQAAIEKIYGKAQGTRYESKKYYAEIIKMYERLGFFPIDAKTTLFD